MDKLKFNRKLHHLHSTDFISSNRFYNFLCRLFCLSRVFLSFNNKIDENSVNNWFDNNLKLFIEIIQLWISGNFPSKNSYGIGSVRIIFAISVIFYSIFSMFLKRSKHFCQNYKKMAITSILDSKTLYTNASTLSSNVKYAAFLRSCV